MQDDKKNILWLVTSYPKSDFDNSSIFLKNLAQRIVEISNFTITVLAPDAPDIQEQKITRKNIVVKHYRYWFKKYQKLAYGDAILSNLKKNHWLYLQVGPYMIAMFFSALTEILKNKPVLLHAHWAFPSGLWAVILGKWFQIPVLVTVHGGDIYRFKKGKSQKILRFIFKRAKTINAVSIPVKQDIMTVARSKIENKVWIQPMGVDERKFHRIENAKEKLGLNTSTNIILYVGRLSEKKGIEYLIRAVPIVNQSISDFKVLIVGSGNMEDKLKSLTNDLKVNPLINFIGAIPNEELVTYYSAADVLVIPSLYGEGFPVTILEGLLTGCKIVTTFAAGNPELKQLQSVIMVEPYNERKIADAIIKFLQQGSQKFEIDPMVRRYSLTRVAENFYQEYERLINENIDFK